MSVTTAQQATQTPGLWPRVYSILSALLLLLVLVQIFVAGGGLFTMAHQLDNNQNYTVSQWNNSAYWGIHFFNALAIAVVILLMLAASFIGKLPGSAKRFSGILVGLLVLQGILGFIPWPSWISALHVLNAFAMLGVAGFVTRDNWAFGRRAT